MATSVSICSNALLMLGAKPISDFDENLDRARLASNLYESARDQVLRSHPWNCATKRVILAPMVDAPAFGYAYQFPLPGDWLRNQAVTDNQVNIDFKAEGRTILADVPALYLRYTFRNEDASTYDAMLIDALTLFMASRMAYPITQSTSLKAEKLQEFKDLIKSARAVDGQDEPPQTFGDFPLLASRY
jgi:hypothetical protein